VSKVHKEQGITSPDMSPRGERPLTRQIRAQSGGEKRPKSISNQLQMAQNSAGSIWRPKEGNPPKMGSFGPSWGACLAYLGPIFGGPPHAASPMTVTWVKAVI